MLENWNRGGMKPRKAPRGPLFLLLLLLRLVFFSPLFPLFLFPTFPVERQREPTSFPMHQEDVRTPWPGSFHPSRFRHRYTRDFSSCIYIYSQTRMNKGEKEWESNDTWRTNVRPFLLPLNIYRLPHCFPISPKLRIPSISKLLTSMHAKITLS